MIFLCRKRKSISKLLMMSAYISNPRRKQASNISAVIHFLICNPLVANFDIIGKHQSVQMIMYHATCCEASSQQEGGCCYFHAFYPLSFHQIYVTAGKQLFNLQSTDMRDVHKRSLIFVKSAY